MEFKSPVYHVIAVPVEKIKPNTYNPNAVAPPEMRLLYDSIKALCPSSAITTKKKIFISSWMDFIGTGSCWNTGISTRGRRECCPSP